MPKSPSQDGSAKFLTPEQNRKRARLPRSPYLVPIIFGGTPNTRARLQFQLHEVPEYLTPSKVDIKKGVTTTPRHRSIKRRRSFGYEAKGEGGSQLVMRLSIFAANDKTPPRAEIKATKYVTRSFGAFIITAKHLTRVGPRSKAKAQNTVMHGKVQDHWDRYIASFGDNLPANLPKTLPYGKPHWCHLLAYTLYAGSINTQVAENLTGGSSKSNYTQKNYERRFKELLNDENIKQMKMSADVTEYANSHVASKIQLHVTFTTTDKRTITTSINIDPNRLVTEASAVSKMFAAPTQAMAESSGGPAKLMR